jgi:hypothetical protein
MIHARSAVIAANWGFPKTGLVAMASTSRLQSTGRAVDSLHEPAVAHHRLSVRVEEVSTAIAIAMPPAASISATVRCAASSAGQRPQRLPPRERNAAMAL